MIDHEAYKLIGYSELVEQLYQLKLRIVSLEFRMAQADAELRAILERWHEQLDTPVN